MDGRIAERRAVVALLVLTGLASAGDDTPPYVRALTPELATVVQGNNAFAWSLYKAAALRKGTLFFSPFSISAAFGMTLSGAAGETATEMRHVLQIRTDRYHESFGDLIRDFGREPVGRSYQLYIASRLFGQKSLPFENDFLDVAEQAYGAPLAEVDYLEQTEAARETINGWVADRTLGRIPNVLGPGVLTVDTALVLANAVYFKAKWAQRFEAERTRTAPFRLANGETVNVPMMSQEGFYRVGFRDDATLLELTYRDEELSMIILLPETHDGLPALEASLNAESVSAMLAAARPSEVAVWLPRFELALELPLRELMQDLGMRRAFDRRQADFSRMLDPSFRRLFIDAAVHKAFVRVDEDGAEAAAATAVEMEVESGPPRFRANHPFVYFIRDRLTGSILFMGRMENPAVSS